MKQALRIGLLLSALLGVALPVWAAPSIDFGMTPGLPGFVQNPGGQLNAWCQVNTDGTTPALLEIRLFDETGQQILLQQFPNTEYYYLYWDVPTGMNDGVYHYQVDYTSVEGQTAQIRAGFLVAGLTRGLCTFKFIDDDGDGIFDEDTEFLASGWQICVTGPINDCKTTDADGVACWFFIPAGTYHVCETLQPGYVPTTPPCQDVVITNSIGKAIFGNKPAPPTGACCAHDGTCSILTQSDCLAQGGTYYGDNTVCIPNPCPPPTGACCYPSGECLVSTADDCAAGGGSYYGDDTVCIPNPCPQPPGACCFPDGHCVVLTEADCLGAGGTWYGAGTVCDPNPCAQPLGACCFADGSCQVLTEAECVGQGGSWYGSGTVCIPNPCPQPLGACCLPSGECTVTSEEICMGSGGTYQGNGTVCDPNPCPQPLGACCLPTGECVVTTADDCAAQNGVYQGDNLLCDPNPCPPPVPTEHTTWGRVKNRFR